MTPDQLEAAIARDCPHRLADYRLHLDVLRRRWNGSTRAFLVLWREQHLLSSDPRLEARVQRLYRAAGEAESPDRLRACLAAASRIQKPAREQAIKEMSDE